MYERPPYLKAASDAATMVGIGARNVERIKEIARDASEKGKPLRCKS